MSATSPQLAFQHHNLSSSFDYILHFLLKGHSNWSSCLQFFSIPNPQLLPHCLHKTYIWSHTSHAQTSLSISLNQSKVHTPPSSLQMKCLLGISRKIHSFTEIHYLKHDLKVTLVTKGKEKEPWEKEQEQMAIRVVSWTREFGLRSSSPCPQHTCSPF